MIAEHDHLASQIDLATTRGEVEALEKKMRELDDKLVEYEHVVAEIEASRGDPRPGAAVQAVCGGVG